MSQSMVNRPTPRVQQVAHLIQQFTPQEIGQLVEFVLSLRRPAQGKRVRYDIVGQDMRVGRTQGTGRAKGMTTARCNPASLDIPEPLQQTRWHVGNR